MGDWVQPYIELVTTGGLGAFAWYSIFVDKPKMETRHQVERKGWLDYIQAKDEKQEKMIERFLITTERILTTAEQLSENTKVMQQALIDLDRELEDLRTSHKSNDPGDK